MTTPRHPLVQAAARNNAEWCAVMSRSHGLSSEFVPYAWTAPSRTPLYYPDAVTLAPDTDPAALLARIDTTTPGASIKDSFADLDLAPAGFHILFEAQWIHRRATAPTTSTNRTWEVVDDPDSLRAWAIAWDNGQGNAGLFRPELLRDPATLVLAERSPGGRVIAGAVASRSDQVIGVSNVFTRGTDPDSVWPLMLDAVRQRFPTLPVVGYEHGDALAAAVHHGFEPIGPLRVWIHDQAKAIATDRAHPDMPFA